MSGLFVGSKISNFYRSARPRYPKSVIKSIFAAWKQLASTPSCRGSDNNQINFSELKKSGVALDVGCGSGQLTELLVCQFAKVIASDVSASQISAAKDSFSASPNMEFHVGDCYSLRCPDRSADLITVAQALHWFDVPKFYTEVARCLKPTGALALLSYSFCTLRFAGNGSSDNETRANQLMHEYFLGEQYIGPYWDSRRQLVDTKYDTLPMYNDKKCIRLTEEMPLELTLSQFVAYLRSQSAYHTYLEKVKPSSPEADVLNQFVSELSPLLQTPQTDPASSEPTLSLVFPLTVIVSVT